MPEGTAINPKPKQPTIDGVPVGEKLRGVVTKLVFGRGRRRRRRSGRKSGRKGLKRQMPKVIDGIPMGEAVECPSTCSLKDIILAIGKLVLLFAVCFHSWQVIKPGWKILSGDAKAGLALMNPFKGLSFTLSSVSNTVNPFTKSDGLLQGVLKVYVTLCIVDFICKFPLKVPFPYTWIVPANPISAFTCLKPDKIL